MKAVRLLGYGDLSQVKLIDVPTPETGAGDILIEVEAAGVIFGDVLARREDYFLKPKLPYAMGREVAGRIIAKGAGVEDYAVGDRVYAFLQDGGYAEKVVASVAGLFDPTGKWLGRTVYPLGPGVSASQALAHGSNLRMAHLMLYHRGQARSGDTVLIHAASGGVGIHLVRLARAHGMEVIALAGSREKADYCLANGAHHAIEYKQRDYVEAVKQITGGKGAQLAMNSVGGDTLMRDAEALGFEGTLIVSGFSAGRGFVSPSTSGKSLNYKHFASFVHFGRPEDDEACAHVARELLAPTHEDRIVPFALADVRAAHELLESGANFGKIVLVP